MRVIHRYMLLVALLIMISPIYAYAVEDEEIDALMTLDIEELTISVASKKSETIKEAPAIVNVVSAEEIRNSGARTLFEVLERQPEIYANGSLSFGEYATAIRGSISSGNHHALILLNGRPIREVYSGGLDMNILRTFPLSMIDHIEIIRGPGSVLYGTNAFTGVVNIITKKATEVNEGEVSTTYGSFNTLGTELTYGSQGKDYQMYGALLLSQTKGWKATAADLTGVVGSDRAQDKQVNIVANASYKNLTLNVMNSYLEDYGWGFPTLYPFVDSTRKQRFVDLGYVHEINEDWSASINGAYTNSTQRFASAAFVDADDWLTELTLKGQVTDKTDIIMGGTWQVLEGEEIRAGTPYDVYRAGAYFQVAHQVLDWLKLVGGLQLNKPEHVKRDFSPRLAAIVDLNDNWSAKLMYGEAFRSAYPAEQFINIPGLLTGDPALKPEKIETYDAQLLYQNGHHYAAFSVFKSKQTDTIRLGFMNGGDIDSYGATLEGKTKLYNDWDIQGSASWLDDEDDLTGGAGYSSANWMAKGGFTYHGWDGITLDIFENFVGGLDVSNNNAPVNPLPDDYHLVTANIIFDLNTFYETLPFDTSFALYGFNLLDEDIDASYPDNPAGIVNTGPARAGRSVYGTLRIRF